MVRDQLFTVNLHHDGIFTHSPLRYQQGDEKQITVIDFEGLKELKTDNDVQDFVRVGYENKWYVDLYVKHFDYDVMDFIKEEANGVLSSGSSDEYYSSDEIEELDDVDFQTEWEKNVALDDPDAADIDPNCKAQKGVTYPKHDPTILWNKMTPILGVLRMIESSKFAKSAKSFKSAKSAKSAVKKKKMAAAGQNTNNTTIRSILLAEKLTGSNFTNWYRNQRIVLRYEKKVKFVEQPTGPALDFENADPNTIDKNYETVNLEQEVACIMLSSMSPDLQRTLEKYNAYDMLKELKTM
ncbi:hypothetical protein Tco_0443165 [Tanacetum coccineum]